MQLQSVVLREPSADLRTKIRECVSVFKSSGQTVTELIQLGESEGFTPQEIDQFVREEMVKA